MERIRKFCILVSFLLLLVSLGVEARADDPQGGLRIIPVRVEFVRPNSTCDYFKGERISIRLRLSRLAGASLPPGTRAVKLTIYDTGGHAYHPPSVPLGGPLVTNLISNFWIPNNIRPGQALITANFADEDGMALSRTIGQANFRIHENHSRISMHVGPMDAQGRHQVGQRINVHYRVRKRVAPCNLTFTLRKGRGVGSGQVISSVTRNYRPVSPDQREPEYSFVFPDTIGEEGEYSVVVTSRPPLFEDASFGFYAVNTSHTLLPPLGARRWSMEVISPRAGVIDIWAGGTVRGIAWRLRGRFPETRIFAVALEDRRGAKVLDISTAGTTFRSSDATYILSWRVPEGLDGAYRIRVTEVNSGVIARSGLFSIGGTGEPSLRFTSPGNGLVVHNNQTLPIRWEARNFPDRGTSREATVTILLVTPTGEMDTLARGIPVSRQSFTWTVDANRRPFDFRSRPETELVGVPPGRGRMGGISYPPGEYRLVMECSPPYNIRLEGPRFRIQ